MEVDRNGLEVLDRAECLRLLGTASLGRIGLTSGALPTVLPVNFRLIDDEIRFRTAEGTKLAAATEHAVVAFEVDEMDLVSHTGWSVVVTGLARRVTEPDALRPEQVSYLPRWAPGSNGAVVGISLDLVSGRRIMTPGPLPGGTPP
jgi:nitroimidazol reductase NimA-like FMN-containing flavoprotein (pyridoxamine 5'-phosphate oxidase superfamily)